MNSSTIPDLCRCYPDPRQRIILGHFAFCLDDYRIENNTTYFCHRVRFLPERESRETPALSHWLIAICREIKSTDILNAYYQPLEPYGAVENVMPDETLEIGPDPTTGLYGLKWNVAVGHPSAGNPREVIFCVTFNHPLALSQYVDFAFKAGFLTKKGSASTPPLFLCGPDPECKPLFPPRGWKIKEKLFIIT